MPNNPLLIVALLVSAVMLAILGTVLPGMMELPPPGDWMMRGAFYLAALGDVGIALWFRARMKRAAPKSGATIERQR